jgi:hypothetical protein
MHLPAQREQLLSKYSVDKQLACMTLFDNIYEIIEKGVLGKIR